jgi:hypothetical protein
MWHTNKQRQRVSVRSLAARATALWWRGGGLTFLPKV